MSYKTWDSTYLFGFPGFRSQNSIKWAYLHWHNLSLWPHSAALVCGVSNSHLYWSCSSRITSLCTMHWRHFVPCDNYQGCYLVFSSPTSGNMVQACFPVFLKLKMGVWLASVNGMWTELMHFTSFWKPLIASEHLPDSFLLHEEFLLQNLSNQCSLQTKNINIIYELSRNAECQAPPQSSINICILTSDLYAH